MMSLPSTESARASSHKLPHGNWQQGNKHCGVYGNAFKDAIYLPWFHSPQVETYINWNPAASKRDIYEFGVYTGNTMKEMARLLPSRKLWGFDSFRCRLEYIAEHVCVC